MARQVSFLGAQRDLVGSFPEAGQKAPAFSTHRFVPGQGLVEVTLADTPAKARLFSVVPSLDTGTCSKQTHAFNEAIGKLGDKVAAYTVSLDLPFAQNRYCGAEGIDNLTVLSDYQDRSFGQSWGVLIGDLKFLARAVFVVDAAGTVVYSQLVENTPDEPDYAPALAALESVA